MHKYLTVPHSESFSTSIVREVIPVLLDKAIETTDAQAFCFDF